MSKPLRVSDEAVADLNAAARWYGERSLKAADAFIDEVQSSFQFIIRSPYGAPKVQGLVRQLPVYRFPFVILYRPFKDHIAVLRVFHTRMDPKKKFKLKR
jgi:plasmid stabilization system protein ParE